MKIPASCLLAAAAAVPLTFYPGVDGYGITKLAAAAALLAAASWAALLESRPAAGGPGLSPWPPLGAFAGVCILSAAFSADPWLGWVGGHNAYGFSLLGMGLCGAAFALAYAEPDPGFRRRLARCVAAVAAAVSVYALLQWGWKDVFSGQALERPFSSLGGSLHLGSFLMLSAPLAWSLAADEAPADRAVGRAAVILGLPALAATGSRSSWLGVLAGLGAWGLLVWGRGRLRRVLLLVLAAGLLLVGLNKGMTALSPARRAAASAQSLDELHLDSDVVRLEIWRCAAAAFRDHPLLGSGINTFADVYRRYKRPVHQTAKDHDSDDAHNDWLQVLATLGLLGAAAYLWLHLGAARLWFRLSPAQRAEPVRAAMAGSLLAFFIQTKLNAMPWPSLFVAALLAGALLGGGRAPGRLAGSLRVAAGVAAAACCLWLAWADHLEFQGLAARGQGRPREAAELLERASALNPWESSYRLNLDNLLWDLASSAPQGSRRLFLDRASQVALDAARRRPADVTAQFLLGHAELRSCEWGGECRLDLARAALERARDLAPQALPVQEDLARIIALRRKPAPATGKRH